MKYEVTITAIWNTDAESLKEAKEILERDWDKLTKTDPSFMNPKVVLKLRSFYNYTRSFEIKSKKKEKKKK